MYDPHWKEERMLFCSEENYEIHNIIFFTESFDRFYFYTFSVLKINWQKQSRTWIGIFSFEWKWNSFPKEEKIMETNPEEYLFVNWIEQARFNKQNDLRHQIFLRNN